MFIRSRSLLMVLLLACTPVATAVAQDGISRKEAERNLARKARDDRKAKARKVKDDRKRHLEIQDKATRKRIKRNTRRADRRGSGSHRDGFFRRMFGG